MLKLGALKLGILGMVLAGVGYSMNVLVMFANNIQMPVVMKGCSVDQMDMMHVCATAQSHLLILADYIHISSAYYSPGDFGVYFGPVLSAIFFPIFVYQLIKSLSGKCHL